MDSGSRETGNLNDDYSMNHPIWRGAEWDIMGGASGRRASEIQENRFSLAAKAMASPRLRTPSLR